MRSPTSSRCSPVMSISISVPTLPPIGMVVSSRGAGRPTDCANAPEAQPRNKVKATAVRGKCREMILMAFFLVVEEEFFGIHHRPNQILEILASRLLHIDLLSRRVNPWLFQVVQRHFQLVGTWFPGERHQVQLLDPGLRRARIPCQPFRPTVGISQLASDIRRIKHVQALSQARRLYSLALAHALAFRPPENAQEWRGLVVAVIRQSNRACAWRQVREISLGAG